jgi:acyl carrier protein
MKINKKDLIKMLNKFGKIDTSVKDSYNFIESGFIDSLNILRFIGEVEKKYKIILDNEFTSSKNFGEIGHLIKKLNQLKKK